MRVVFAEKPSMGRAIAAALGLPATGRTHIQGKDKDGRDVIVTWGVGHLVELLGGFEDYNPALKAWSAGSLPFIPEQFKTQVIYSSRDQFSEVEKILSAPEVDEVVVATDPGREGELIALYALAKIAERKTRGGKGQDLWTLLNSKFKKIYRLWPKSLTDTGIIEAYKAMKPWSTYKPLTDAAQSRSEADWIVGLNGTRALTLLARRLGRTEKGAWAVGRVMTPTLAILVNRELEIQNFKSKDYWVLEATFKAAAGTYKGTWFKKNQSPAEGEPPTTNRFVTAADAQTALAKIQNMPGKIVKLDVNEVREAPEMLYDLTDLQREANKRFGYSAAKTLEIAQDLYEAKYLSYPRTNSKHLTGQDAAEIPHWLKALGGMPDYAAFVKTIGPKPAPLGKRYVDDDEVEDHHALAPTDKAPNLASLPEDQRRIYDLVARRFMAAFFPPRIKEKTVIITDVSGETFRTNGTVIKDPGWSIVDTPSQSKSTKKKKGGADDDDDDAASGLPVVKLHEDVKVLDPKTVAKATEPPKRLTEADLLLAMKTAGKDIEDEAIKDALKGMGVIGIGTPATRAATIEKLVSKGSPKYPKDPLVQRQGKMLVPTARGITLILMIPVLDLKSPELTGKWESQLEEVGKGKRLRSGFMDLISVYTKNLVGQMLGATPASLHLPEGTTMNDTAESSAPRPERFEPQQLDKCPKCAGTLWLKCYDGRFYAKCDTADCKVTYDTDAKGAAVGGTCKNPECGGPVKVTKNGSKICVKCETWQNERPAGDGPGAPSGDTKGPCPKCGNGVLRQRSGQYGPFVSCSDRECGLLYNVDAKGEPTGGWCKKCKGPVKLTQKGSKLCVVCNTWQDEGQGGAPTGDRPPKPADAKCPKCQEPLKAIFTKKGAWAYRCEPCASWFDAPK